MMSKEKTAKLVLIGHYIYDNMVPMAFHIFAINFDYYFDLDEGYLDEDEIEELNQNGEQYVVLNNSPEFFNTKSNVTFAGLTLEEAMKTTQNRIPQEINWEKV